MLDGINFGDGEIFHNILQYFDLDVSLEKQDSLLGEDLLSVLYMEGKFIIDVGWYGSENGRFIVTVGEDSAEESHDLYTLKESIIRAVDRVHVLMKEPEPKIDYRMVFSTPERAPDKLDHLLGEVMVEWEREESQVTVRMLEEAERTWNLRLPNELRNIVLNCNGGIPIPCFYKNGRGSGSHIESLLSFNVSDEDNVHKKLSTYSFPERMIPIENSGRRMLCLDYRENEAEPGVVLVTFSDRSSNAQIEEEEKIAPSFLDFLARMYFHVNWSEEVSKGDYPWLIQQLEEVEKEWGIILPLHYKKLVIRSNGGEPEYRRFFHEIGGDMVESLLRVGKEKDEKSVIEVYEKHFKDTLYYPFALCESGRILCLDYHERKEHPPVVLWDGESDRFYEVKDTFSHWLDYLQS